MYYISFGLLGLVIGNLVGLTVESVVASLIPLLFAFGGGSMLAFLGKLSIDDRRAALKSITAMSLLCLIGVYIGIAVSEYQVLTPKESRGIKLQLKDKDGIAARKYLREQLLPEVVQIQELVANRRLTEQEGYREMVKALERQK